MTASRSDLSHHPTRVCRSRAACRRGHDSHSFRLVAASLLAQTHLPPEGVTPVIARGLIRALMTEPGGCGPPRGRWCSPGWVGGRGGLAIRQLWEQHGRTEGSPQPPGPHTPLPVTWAGCPLSRSLPPLLPGLTDRRQALPWKPTTAKMLARGGSRASQPVLRAACLGVRKESAAQRLRHFPLAARGSRGRRQSSEPVPLQSARGPAHCPWPPALSSRPRAGDLPAL